jgi:hypothetical protein
MFFSSLKRKYLNIQCQPILNPTIFSSFYLITFLQLLVCTIAHRHQIYTMMPVYDRVRMWVQIVIIQVSESFFAETLSFNIVETYGKLGFQMYI